MCYRRNIASTSEGIKARGFAVVFQLFGKCGNTVILLWRHTQSRHNTSCIMWCISFLTDFIIGQCCKIMRPSACFGVLPFRWTDLSLTACYVTLTLAPHASPGLSECERGNLNPKA